MPSRETRNNRIGRIGVEYKQHTTAASQEKKAADDCKLTLLKLVSPEEPPVEVEYEGKLVRVAAVQKDAPKYLDETAFQRSLPTKVWNQISRRQIDQNLLKAAIDSGDITEAQVEAFMKEGTTPAPYVNVTIKDVAK